MRRHKRDERTFRELSVDEQVNSLNASINNLEKMLVIHIDASEETNRAHRRRVLLDQLMRVINNAGLR